MVLTAQQKALLASYRKVAAEADKKLSLVRALAAKGPKAIQAASETAAKAARRRDVLATQLAQAGVADIESALRVSAQKG